jgi:transmembrane sensor
MMNPGTDSAAVEARAAEWLARRASERWTAEDEALFDAWLEGSTAHRVAFVRLDAAWQHSARLKALGAGVQPGVIPVRQAWRFSPLFNQKSVIEPSPGTRSHAIQWGLIAAAFVLAVGLTAGGYLWNLESNSYRTRVGSTQTIPLSDGSEVILNTNSRIRVKLDEVERRIELNQGEAFFVVAKDAHRPFMVVVGEKRIVAVGTRFSVRRVDDEVQIAVTEGKVRLEGVAEAPATQLDAGAVAQTKDVLVRVQHKPLPDVEQVLSWRTGYVTFRDTQLSEAVAEFNRYSSRKIIVRDPAIAGIRIGGNFRINNADAFLWLLEHGFAVRVERQDDRVILKGR